MRCKNCQHEIGKVANKLRHITKNKANDKCYLCECTNPEPEGKKEITQILSEIQEWREVE